MNAPTVSAILALRQRGLSAGQIAYRLSLNESTVRNWWNPRTCSDCGARISWGTSRCPACAMQPKFWTREAIIEAMLAVNGIVLASDDESLAQAARRLFGDWHTACAAAGVQSLHVGENRRDIECRPTTGEDAQPPEGTAT